MIRCHSRLGNHRKNEDFFITFFEILKGVRQHTLLITQAEGGVGRKMGECFNFEAILYQEASTFVPIRVECGGLGYTAWLD